MFLCHSGPYLWSIYITLGLALTYLGYRKPSFDRPCVTLGLAIMHLCHIRSGYDVPVALVFLCRKGLVLWSILITLGLVLIYIYHSGPCVDLPSSQRALSPTDLYHSGLSSDVLYHGGLGSVLPVAELLSDLYVSYWARIWCTCIRIGLALMYLYHSGPGYIYCTFITYGLALMYGQAWL
jgi:hypothetical protein